MVINVGELKSRNYGYVSNIRSVVEASRPFGVKVILETLSSIPSRSRSPARAESWRGLRENLDGLVGRHHR